LIERKNNIINLIHPTAIIDESALLGSNVKIGPYSVIGENADIGDNTVIGTMSIFFQMLKLELPVKYFMQALLVKFLKI